MFMYNVYFYAAVRLNTCACMNLGHTYACVYHLFMYMRAYIMGLKKGPEVLAEAKMPGP
jgi:hypothetical protein